MLHVSKSGVAAARIEGNQEPISGILFFYCKRTEHKLCVHEKNGGDKEMQLSITTDYALRILLYLAEKRAVTPSAELARNLSIHQPLVLRVGRVLKQKGFIDIPIGPLGGLVLIKRPEEVTVYDIVRAMEHSIKLNRCLDDGKLCSRGAASHCSAHAFLGEVQELMEEKMKTKTLADLLEDNNTSKKKPVTKAKDKAASAG